MIHFYKQHYTISKQSNFHFKSQNKLVNIVVKILTKTLKPLNYYPHSRSKTYVLSIAVGNSVLDLESSDGSILMPFAEAV